MTLTFATRKEIGSEAWDSFAEASQEGWVFATDGWQELILKVDEWALEDVSFGAYEDGALVAIMPLQHQPEHSRAASSGWGLAGPLLNSKLDGKRRTKILRQVLSHAEDTVANLGVTSLEIGLSPATQRALTTLRGVNPFAEAGYEDQSGITRMIDLHVSQDELWSGLSANARQMVRKAQQAGYTTQRVTWISTLDEYYTIHIENYERTGVSPHPRTYFEGIAQYPGQAGHSVLFAGLDPDGTKIAFHNDARFNVGCLYHTGCSSADHLDSGINYLLMWDAICAAKNDGFEWYNVGDVFPAATQGKQHGLSVFKSKFGGELHRSFRARKGISRTADSSNEPTQTKNTDDSLRGAYNSGDLYTTEKICIAFNAEAKEYTERLLHDRFDLVNRHYEGGILVDLCCAAGVHLVDIASRADVAIGLDFSERYLKSGAELAAKHQRDNVFFAGADARRLPLETEAIDFLYCFSSLYAFPGAREAIEEIGRSLRPGGKAVLDLGNRHSMNAYCLKHYPEWPPLQGLSVAEMKAALKSANLNIIEHRRFQLLPLWAGRPEWLWPLLHPVWQSILKRRVFGRMLDEWVSSLPILRRFAFRHLIVVRRS